MSRYVDADAMIARAFQDSERMYLESVARHTPSIDIVRCSECKHYVAETDSGDGREWSSCEYWLREINDDDFCSYGERITNE